MVNREMAKKARHIVTPPPFPSEPPPSKLPFPASQLSNDTMDHSDGSCSWRIEKSPDGCQTAFQKLFKMFEEGDDLDADNFGAEEVQEVEQELVNLRRDFPLRFQALLSLAEQIVASSMTVGKEAQTQQACESLVNAGIEANVSLLALYKLYKDWYAYYNDMTDDQLQAALTTRTLMIDGGREVEGSTMSGVSTEVTETRRSGN